VVTGLLLHFMQQHRRGFVIAHALDLACVIPNHEFGMIGLDEIQLPPLKEGL
jgi:hypothetical protein